MIKYIKIVWRARKLSKQITECPMLKGATFWGENISLSSSWRLFIPRAKLAGIPPKKLPVKISLSHIYSIFSDIPSNCFVFMPKRLLTFCYLGSLLEILSESWNIQEKWEQIGCNWLIIAHIFDLPNKQGSKMARFEQSRNSNLPRNSQKSFIGEKSSLKVRFSFQRLRLQI